MTELGIILSLMAGMAIMAIIIELKGLKWATVFFAAECLVFGMLIATGVIQ